MLAHAESGETVYQTEGAVPTIKSETKTKENKSGSTSGNHKSSNSGGNESSTAAHASNAEENSSEKPEEEESGSEGHKSQGGAAAGGNGNPPTKSGGEGGNNASKGGANSEGSIGEKQKVTPVKNVAHTESSGGSSPVVPILIAVVVLAAISIGVVLYRQRKSGQGPDRRATSPGAS